MGVAPFFVALVGGAAPPFPRRGRERGRLVVGGGWCAHVVAVTGRMWV